MKALAKEVQQDFGRAATSYDAHALLQREVLQHAAHMLAQHIPPDARVLDAGCGTGALMECDIPPWGIIGADIAAPMCAMAARRGVSALCADIQCLPLKDASMDAAVCSLALQWVESRPLVFAELWRVIPPGGYAAVTLFGQQTLRELRDTLGNAHVHAFPALPQLVQEAKSAGWQCAQHQSKIWRHTHDTLAQLMHSLKAIGAANKQPARRRGLTTPEIFRRAESRYRERFGCIRATWEVHTLLLRKP